jgi:mannitol/fructose-specific phosphotransferase system IIA component (Ntr-type)
MKLADHLDESWIDVELRPADRDDALRRVVELFQSGGAVTDVREATRRLVYREDVMSTSVEPGVALPHALSDAVSRSVVSVCRCPDGVDFNAPDGAPVQLLFTLLGPADARATHVKLLARIARILRQEGAREELLAAGSPAELAAAVRRRDDGAG